VYHWHPRLHLRLLPPTLVDMGGTVSPSWALPLFSRLSAGDGSHRVWYTPDIQAGNLRRRFPTQMVLMEEIQGQVV